MNGVAAAEEATAHSTLGAATESSTERATATTTVVEDKGAEKDEQSSLS
jgi:hypothetical protein